jgi:hypothetical protein
MYKMLMFLKKTDDPNVLNHFKNFTLPVLNELSRENIKSAKVESSLLIEKKYNWFCEVAVGSKNDWDRLMTTKEGKKLNKDLADFHNSVDLIFVNYEEEL